MNKRIPRKPGQPAGSDKHSDLYTDENPKGTIHGLKFATAEDAEKSVNKIKNSGRSHAHKIQAAIAMEQRARVMGKTSAAAVYRKFINAMKKKTKQRNEDAPAVNTSAIPNPIDTALIKNVPKKKIQELLERQAFKRLGKFEDIANIVDYSSKNAFCINARMSKKVFIFCRQKSINNV